jgi:hypothetical protein
MEHAWKFQTVPSIIHKSDKKQRNGIHASQKHKLVKKNCIIEDEFYS